jgi:four helix bundle protein
VANEDFAKLVLWQKSQSLALQVVRLVSSLPRNRAAETIGNQLLRAAGSVPANVAEGYGRYSQAAYRNHLSIARGSLFETESWVDLLYQAGFVTEAARTTLTDSCHEVGRMLTARMRSLGEAKQTYAREESVSYDID